jgi:hypothetical protein
MMSDIVVYDSGEIELKIALKNETLWLNQKQIVELFDKNQRIGEFLAIKNFAFYDSAYKFTEGFLR